MDKLSAGRRCAGALSGIGVFVLAVAHRLLWLRLGRPVEQEGAVRRDEAVGRAHGVGVEDLPVLACEGDEGRSFPQAVLETGSYLFRPLLEPCGRVGDD